MKSTILLFYLFCHTTNASSFLEDRQDSPYEACKGQAIVKLEDYSKNKSEWAQLEKDCQQKAILIQDISYLSPDPLNEGLDYLQFGIRVALKVKENLLKSKTYADCSASCFSGAVTCAPDKNEKIVTCSERKKNIQGAMKVYARRLRMEMALSDDNNALVIPNIQNILQFGPHELINTELTSFDMGMPNPTGGHKISAAELKEAKRRIDNERQRLEDEFSEKTKGMKSDIYSQWMSIKRMENLERHRENYKRLVYEEAPIFSVLPKPLRYEHDSDPVWDDSQIANAFKVLSQGATDTIKKVDWSLDNNSLEFSRLTGRALLEYGISIFQEGNRDLSFYVGMKKPVEEVLREDPSQCGIAFEINRRMHTKKAQNLAAAVASAFVGSEFVQLTAGATSKGIEIGGYLLKAGKAISAVRAAELTGFAMGAANLGQSFNRYNELMTQMKTTSGLGGDEEGTTLFTHDEIDSLKKEIMLTATFGAVNGPISKMTTKLMYSTLSHSMVKDFPALKSLALKAQTSEIAREELVSAWLKAKLKFSFEKGLLNKGERAILESDKGWIAFDVIVREIINKSPDFFKEPKNMDLIFKAALSVLKKETGNVSKEIP